MPKSFTPEKIKQTYLKLKQYLLKEKSTQKIGEKVAEYFLFLFKAQKMYPEIIDLCENFEKVTGIA